MKILDLFSGIGGFSLGLERAGMETVAFCEIEEYPRSILEKNWPDVPIANDVSELEYIKQGDEPDDWLLIDRSINSEIYRGAIDVICGGFPCQPFSVAGKQRGKEDDRHLWPQMFRLLQEIRPRWLIGENVAGFITMALDDLLSDLEGEGYTAQTFVVPACAVGGIHRRDRVWIVAHSPSFDRRGQSHQPCGNGAGTRDESRRSNSRDVPNTKHNGASATTQPGSQRAPICDNEKRANQAGEPSGVCAPPDVANSGHGKNKRYRRNGNKVLQKQEPNGPNEAPIREANTEFKPIGIPTQPPVCSADDGVSRRMVRLKALGNAVVPQIPELIGRKIMFLENGEQV